MKKSIKSHGKTPPLLALVAGLAVAAMAQPGQAQHIGNEREEIAIAQVIAAKQYLHSEQEEITIGQQIAVKLERYVLPANHPMALRVSAIGRQFARLSVRRNIPYTYKVLDAGAWKIVDPKGGPLNAGARPGGPIYITLEYVNLLSNDAELAAVLGHETAHIDRKHHLKESGTDAKAALKGLIVGGLLGLGKPRGARESLQLRAFGAFQSRYSRRDEDEADAVGLRWMSRLGYDPQAALAEMAKFIRLEEAAKKQGDLEAALETDPDRIKERMDQIYFGTGVTHPDARKRIQKLIQIAQQENLLQVARRAGGPRKWLASRYPQEALSSRGGYALDFRETPYLFRAPLRIVRAGNDIVPMLPSVEFARWAGITYSFSRDGSMLVLLDGNVKLALPANSNMVYINGKALRMSAASRDINGVAYAPCEVLASVFDVQLAGVDKERGLLWLVVLGRPRGVLALR